MVPTLANGSLILVDYLRDVPRQDCLYVFRSDGALLVKRARWRRASWWWYSDNPRWEPFPLEGSMRVWGEVRWWWYSDNPRWEPFPLEGSMRVWGEVRWWWYSDNPRWEPFPLEGSMRVWGEVRWYFCLFDDNGNYGN